ncbi:HNH endonuclease [Kineosporia sp. J2-2]|uniref:HNH endonuclease n=1 Tax=Kineosporia corallincola TaxID=2835133 RepID=A0ABS5TL39_9ACTN|nr:HNH endonuclease [Kineosporia corallincola]
MPWSASPRTASSKRTSTYHWQQHIRPAALARDQYQCTHVEHGARCAAPAEQVDHVTPASTGGTDDLGNAASLCLTHHKAKIQAEAAAARPSARRPAQRHPGLL